MVKKDGRLHQISIRDNSNRGLIDEIDISPDSVDVLYRDHDGVFNYVAWPKTFAAAENLVKRINAYFRARKAGIRQARADALAERLAKLERSRRRYG